MEEVKLGTLTNRKIGYGIVQPGNSIPNGIPIIKVNNIISGLKNVKDLEKTSIENDKKYSRTKLIGGELIVSVVGTIGKTAIVPKEFAGCNLVRATAMVDIRDSLLSMWVKYYIDSPIGQSYIRENLNTTVQPTLNINSLVEMPIPFFSRECIKQIVSILKSLDDKIEVNRRINENLEQQAQALFKSWLNNCHEKVTIGDLSLNITDYTKCDQNQVVLVNSSDVTEGHFMHHNLSENKNLKGHFKKRFKKGDILYSQVRPRNRHWGYCTFESENYLASTQLMVIRNKADVIPSILLYQYIIDDIVWMDFTLRTETRSGTFPQGNYEDLSSIKVPYGADVNDISSKLESLYSIVYNNEQESRRLASLRDTLLPRLMSGELKVNEIENVL